MLSLYRRHRPKTFDEVVGQDGVVRTLRNAIELDKVHHAYLFVGSRGTGKTSMAKLLACALNAAGGPRSDFSPDDPACREIMAGTSLDVVEMDAASNNSVDDIRQLRESVALAPMGGARRVYILDEAHMLSPAAWNAFLKTLEEPPPHVVFVLATTEAHKVPATIVDRCHRFDFGRPSLEQIAGVLRRVADEEGITIPDAALGMIARKAAGSFRDALGTLEQLVTYGGPEVVLEDVLQNLGVADLELVFAATDALVEKDPRAALLAVQRLADSGRDYEQFMRDLAAQLRHLVVTQVCGEVPESFSVTAEHTDRLASQAERIARAELLRDIDLLAAAIAAVKDGSEPRLALEVALLKGAQPQADGSLGALMLRIDGLEARLGGAAAPLAGGASEPPPGPPARPVAAEPDEPEPKPEPEPAEPDEADRPEPGRPPHDRGSVAAAAPARAVVAVGAVAGEGGVRAAGAVAAVAGVEVEAPAGEPGGDASVDLELVRSVWTAVADAVREQNAMVAALVAEGEPTALEGRRLTVAFPAEAAFLKKKAEANRELVLDALRSLTGAALGVRFELGERQAGREEPALGADELLERLKAEFGAREIFEDDGDE